MLNRVQSSSTVTACSTCQITALLPASRTNTSTHDPRTTLTGMSLRIKPWLHTRLAFVRPCHALAFLHVVVAGPSKSTAASVQNATGRNRAWAPRSTGLRRLFVCDATVGNTAAVCAQPRATRNTGRPTASTGANCAVRRCALLASVHAFSSQAWLPGWSRGLGV